MRRWLSRFVSWAGSVGWVGSVGWAESVGWAGSRVRRLNRRLKRARQQISDGGTATAEYAIATLAACGFAGLLLVILRSGEVRSLLFGMIRRALSVS